MWKGQSSVFELALVCVLISLCSGLESDQYFPHSNQSIHLNVNQPQEINFSPASSKCQEAQQSDCGKILYFLKPGSSQLFKLPDSLKPQLYYDPLIDLEVKKSSFEIIVKAKTSEQHEIAELLITIHLPVEENFLQRKKRSTIPDTPTFSLTASCLTKCITDNNVYPEATIEFEFKASFSVGDHNLKVEFKVIDNSTVNDNSKFSLLKPAMISHIGFNMQPASSEAFSFVTNNSNKAIHFETTMTVTNDGSSTNEDDNIIKIKFPLTVSNQTVSTDNCSYVSAAVKNKTSQDNAILFIVIPITVEGGNEIPANLTHDFCMTAPNGDSTIERGSQVSYQFKTHFPLGSTLMDILFYAPSITQNYTGTKSYLEVTKLKVVYVGSNLADSLDINTLMNDFVYIIPSGETQFTVAKLHLNAANTGAISSVLSSSLAIEWDCLVGNLNELENNASLSTTVVVSYGNPDQFWSSANTFQLSPNTQTNPGDAALILETDTGSSPIGKSVIIRAALQMKQAGTSQFYLEAMDQPPDNALEIVNFQFDDYQGAGFCHITSSSGTLSTVKSQDIGGQNVAVHRKLYLDRLTNTQFNNLQANDEDHKLYFLITVNIPASTSEDTLFKVGLTASSDTFSATLVINVIAKTMSDSFVTQTIIQNPVLYNTNPPMHPDTYVAVFADVYLSRFSKDVYKFDLQLPNRVFQSNFHRIKILHVGSSITASSQIDKNELNITSDLNNNNNNRVQGTLGTYFHDGRVSNNTKEDDRILLEIVFSFKGADFGMDTLQFTVSNSKYTALSSKTFVAYPINLAESNWPYVITLEQGNIYGNKIYIEGSQIAKLNIQTVANKYFQLKETIRVNTGDRRFSICEVRMKCVENVICNEKDFDIQYLSKYSGSLFEEVNIYSKEPVTNVLRTDSASPEVDHVFSILVLLCHDSPIPGDNYGLRVDLPSGIFNQTLNYVYSNDNSSLIGNNPSFKLLTTFTNFQLAYGESTVITLQIDNAFNSMAWVMSRFESLNKALRVCGIRVYGEGNEIGPILSNRQFAQLSPKSDDYKSVAALNLGRLTNIDQDNEIDKPEDNRIFLRIEAALRNDPAGYLRPRSDAQFIATLSLAGTETTISKLYEVKEAQFHTVSGFNYNISFMNESNMVYAGGYSTVKFTFATESNKFAPYQLNISITGEASNLDKFHLSDAEVVDVEMNNPCVSDIYVKKSKQCSQTGQCQAISLDFGAIKNLGSSSSGNKITVELTVGSTAQIPHGLTYNVNFLIQSDSQSDSRTLNFLTNNTYPDYAFQPNITLEYPSDTLSHKTGLLYQLHLHLPESVNNFSVKLDTDTINTNVVPIFFTSFETTYWGYNYANENKRPVSSYVSDEGTAAYNHAEMNGVITNTGRSKRNTQRPHGDFDDRLTIAFRLLAADIPENSQGVTRNFALLFKWGNSFTKLFSKTVTIDDSVVRTPVLQNVQYSPPVDVNVAQTGGSIILKAQINHTTESAGTAYHVSFFYFIPLNMQYVDFAESSITTTSIQTVMKGGAVEFKFPKIEKFDNVTVTIKVSILPKVYTTNFLLSGLLEYYYANRAETPFPQKSEKKLAGPSGTDVTIDLDVYKPLGLESNDIKDCQITASSEVTGGEVTNIRPTSSTGWTTFGNGFPFYQNEYVQIIFHNWTRITGLRIYPGMFDSKEVKVNKVVLRYSREGIYWFTYEDQYKQPLNLTAKYETGQSYALLKIPNPFECRFLRVYPASTEGVNPIIPKFSMKMEVLGQTLDSNFEYIDPCTYSDKLAESTYFSERSYVVEPVNDTVFSCALAKIRDLPRCFVSQDQGTTWFMMDEKVVTVSFADAQGYIYGVLNDRNSPMLSKDLGYSWNGIPEKDFLRIMSFPDSVNAVSLPYEANMDNPPTSQFRNSNANKYGVSKRGITMEYNSQWEDIAYWGGAY